MYIYCMDTNNNYGIIKRNQRVLSTDIMHDNGYLLCTFDKASS